LGESEIGASSEGTWNDAKSLTSSNRRQPTIEGQWNKGEQVAAMDLELDDDRNSTEAASSLRKAD